MNLFMRVLIFMLAPLGAAFAAESPPAGSPDDPVLGNWI